MALQLDILDADGRPLVLQATRVVVRDAATQTPIAFAVTIGPQQHIAAAAADPDFARMLQGLRIDDTVIVQHYRQDQLPSITL